MLIVVHILIARVNVDVTIKGTPLPSPSVITYFLFSKVVVLYEILKPLKNGVKARKPRKKSFVLSLLNLYLPTETSTYNIL